MTEELKPTLNPVEIIRRIKHSVKQKGTKQTWSELKSKYYLLQSPIHTLKVQALIQFGLLMSLLMGTTFNFYHKNWIYGFIFCFALLLMYIQFRQTLNQKKMIQESLKQYEDLTKEYSPQEGKGDGIG